MKTDRPVRRKTHRPVTLCSLQCKHSRKTITEDTTCDIVVHIIYIYIYIYIHPRNSDSAPKQIKYEMINGEYNAHI